MVNQDLVPTPAPKSLHCTLPVTTVSNSAPVPMANNISQLSYKGVLLVLLEASMMIATYEDILNMHRLLAMVRWAKTFAGRHKHLFISDGGGPTDRIREAQVKIG